MLEQRVHPDTGRKRWCLVSRTTGRVLRWFGTKKPSPELVARAEAIIRRHAEKGG